MIIFLRKASCLIYERNHPTGNFPSKDHPAFRLKASNQEQAVVLAHAQAYALIGCLEKV